MNPNFSEEIQTLYKNILMQHHNIAYASMIAAFSSAAVNSLEPGPNTSAVAHNTSNYSLDTDIPKDEIECDIEIILVRSLNENLKKGGSNLHGYHKKKCGFREVVEGASARSAYPITSSKALMKRNRNSLDEPSSSPTLGVPFNSSMTISNDVKENSLKKSRHDDTVSGLDESTTSSHEGELQIDLNETSEDLTDVKPSVKTENVETNIDEAAAVDGEAEMMIREPAVEINEQDTSCKEYNPARHRVERLKNIQKKKPKFNINTLDLTYHSNMARHFPGSENRTEDQQNRRSKNTLAARISRTKNKAYEEMLSAKAVEATFENFMMKRKIACLRVYASSLMTMNGLPDPNFGKMWEDNIKNIVSFAE